MAPGRTRTLAGSLLEALRAEVGEKSEAAATLNDRVITDSFLRAEADRDQNVYLGPLFTRVLTRAVPDLIFQPVSLGEATQARPLPQLDHDAAARPVLEERHAALALRDEYRLRLPARQEALPRGPQARDLVTDLFDAS